MRVEAERLSAAGKGTGEFEKHEAGVQAAWEALEGSRRTFQYLLSRNSSSTGSSSSSGKMKDRHIMLLTLYCTCAHLHLCELRALRGEPPADVLQEALEAQAGLLRVVSTPLAPCASMSISGSATVSVPVVAPLRLQSLLTQVHIILGTAHKSALLFQDYADDMRMHIQQAKASLQQARGDCMRLIAAYSAHERVTTGQYTQVLRNTREVERDLQEALEEVAQHKPTESAQQTAATAPAFGMAPGSAHFNVQLDLSPYYALFSWQAELGVVAARYTTGTINTAAELPDPLCNTPDENEGIEEGKAGVSVNGSGTGGGDYEWLTAGPHVGSQVLLRDSEEEAGGDGSLWELAHVVGYLPASEAGEDGKGVKEAALWKVRFHYRTSGTCRPKPAPTTGVEVPAGKTQTQSQLEMSMAEEAEQMFTASAPSALLHLHTAFDRAEWDYIDMDEAELLAALVPLKR